MARVEIPMPQMGESIAEGTLSAWLKRVGDAVASEEPIIEISTDKVDAEIPSPAAGILVEIAVPEGRTVPVGTVVGYIETDPALAATSGPQSENVAGSEAERVAGGAGSESVVPDGPGVGTGTGPTTGAPAGAGSEAVPSPTAGDRPTEEDGSSLHATAGSEEARLRTHSSPLVRRMVEENGLRLDAIEGSGRAGRVTKADVLRHLAQGGASASARPAAAVEGRQAPAAGSEFDWDAFYGTVVHPTVATWEGDKVEPMSRMTSIIADRMVLSRRTAAHVHSFFEIDYTRVDQLRSRNRELWDEQGIRVNYTAFVALAAAQALREFPELNAAVSGNDVIYRGAINLGVAVAIDRGLVVPVIRDADELSLVGLARAIQDFATRAREKKLSPEELQGGTFTITNPGVFGTVIGFPILNQPQVGILGMGVVEKRAVVVEDEFGHDAIVARRMGFLSLGFDHRLVNGADADRFTGRIKQILESIQE